MAEYELTRASGQCSACGRALTEGEEFYSIVVETPEGFSRQDISLECWNGPPAGVLCFFKTRLARKEKPRNTFVDNEVLVHFFLRLANHAEAFKLRFRFVLALVLLRRRQLKYERTIREEGREYWEMRLMRDKTLHKVFNPILTDEEIEELTGELGSILQGQAGDSALIPDEDASSVESSETPAASGEPE